MDDPFDRLDGEAARLDGFFAGLSGDQWGVESRCPGWDRRKMLAHLIGIEDYIRAGLDDRVAEYTDQAGPGVGYEQLNEYLISKRAGVAAEELLAQWRGQVAELHPRLRAAGAEAIIATQAGPYPLGRQAWYLASELAIHADDIAVPVTAAERDDRLGWRLAFALEALAEYGKTVQVESTTAGYRVTAGAESATLTAAGLVEAASGRLPHGEIPEALRRGLVVLA